MTTKQSEHKSWLLAAIGSTGALLATSCCIAPLLLFVMGVSGAWIGYLTVLKTYQPIFITLALLCLAAAYWMVYFRSQPTCEEGSYCAKPASQQILKTILALATALIALALAFPYLAPWLLY